MFTAKGTNEVLGVFFLNKKISIDFELIEPGFRNVQIRNKAISEFKKPNSNVKVIMLSLEHAASGTNLTEAEYVFLLDPVSGTREEARAIESQAIGRAHRQGQTKQVTVVRHIVRSTIEHDMYLNTAALDIAEAESAPAGPAANGAATAVDEDEGDIEMEDGIATTSTVTTTATTTTTMTTTTTKAATVRLFLASMKFWWLIRLLRSKITKRRRMQWTLTLVLLLIY